MEIIVPEPITRLQTLNKIKKVIASFKPSMSGTDYLHIGADWTLLGPENNDPPGCNLDQVYPAFHQRLNDVFTQYGISIEINEMQVSPPTFFRVRHVRSLVWDKLPQQYKKVM